MSDLISRQAAIDAVMKYGKQIPAFTIAVKDALENLPSAHLENERQATVSSDCVSRQDLINWLSYIESHCLEEYAYGYHKTRAYVEQMPSAQPERTCVNCGRTANNGGWYADGGTRCPIEEHYALPKDGYCHLWEKRKEGAKDD